MKIDGFSPQMLQNLQTTEKAGIANLREGSVISAQVIGVSDESAQLKLPNGAVINAKIESTVQLAAGDNVKLKLTDSASYPPLMQLMHDAPSAKGMLTQMGERPTPQNLEILSQLSQNGSLNPETFRAASALMEVSGMDVRTAVFMAMNGMSADKAPAFLQLINSDSSLAQGIDQLLNALGINTAGEEPAEQQPAIQQGVPQGTAPQGDVPQGSVPQSGALLSDTEVLPNAAGLTPEKVTPQIQDQQIQTARQQGTVAQIFDSLVQTDPKIETAIAPVRQQIAEFLRQEPQPTAEQAKSFAAALPVPEDAKAQIFALINAAINPKNTGEPKLIHTADSLFAKIAGKAEDGARMKQVTEELGQKLEELKSTIAATMKDGPGKQAALRQADNLISQVKVAQDINKFAFAQIPIRYEQDSKNAQLYVLKRDGKKRIDPENATLLISLDTQHMGVVESLIKVTGKDVTLQMRMDGEDKIMVFKENTFELYNLLKEVGYKLSDARFTQIETPVNPTNAESVVAKEFMGKQGVDIKA